jgi:radical SAM protein with 4Fe4S-binding SPASM domain
VKVRPEWNGALVAIERPHALVSVNRAWARRLGVTDSPRWQGDDPGHLSAPTEVHLVVSKRCSAGCTSCYVDATPTGPALELAQAKEAIDRLAALGVFHVALGGGEAMELDYLFELAHYARSKGLVPNLTTSGLGLTAAQAQACVVFGQINVSVDGVGEAYQRARGFDGFPHAVKALTLLRAACRRVGINFVVSRTSFDALPDVVALARSLKLDEVELLRFKPAGRGVATFAKEDLTDEQARAMFPLVRKLTFRHRIRLKLDCSFAPMVFWHKPSLALARFFGVVGCEGGNVLASVMPDGSLTGCSFGGPVEASIFDEAGVRAAVDHGFQAFRSYASRAPEPCRSCEYLPLCNGGCRVVAKAAGDWWQPDPGCPRVVAFRHASKTPSVVGGPSATAVVL